MQPDQRRRRRRRARRFPSPCRRAATPSCSRRDADVGGQRGQPGQERERRDGADDGDLGDRLDRLEDRLGPSRLRSPLSRVDAPEVRFQRLRRGRGSRPAPTPTTSAAATQAPAIGATASDDRRRARRASVRCSPAALEAHVPGWRSRRRSRGSAPRRACDDRAAGDRRSRAARRRARASRSRSGLRATCPFSRARLRCLAVGFSVRSSRGHALRPRAARRARRRRSPTAGR